MKVYRVYLSGNTTTMPNFSVRGTSMTSGRMIEDKRGSAINPPAQWAVLSGDEVVALIPFSAAVTIEEEVQPKTQN